MSTLILAAGILRHVAGLRPLYLVAACAAGVVLVTLLVLLRGRWQALPALSRCAVLSLLVHLVLVLITMTVKLVVGDGGAGIGPPIHVRIVDDVARDGDLEAEAVAAPELIAAAIEDVVDVKPESEPDTAQNEEPVEAPSLMAAPEPKVVVEEVTAKAPEEIGQEMMPEQRVEARAVSTIESPAQAAPTPVAARRMPATSPYAHRNAADRLHWAEEQGGGQNTEAAVVAALDWLARVQSPDGRWDASQFGAGQEFAVLGQDRGGAGADADTGITALALLAFLGAGHTHEDGDYRQTVAKGIEYLQSNQSADGCMGGNAGLYARMYCHSMSSFAMAEALALSGDERLRPTVQRAINYSIGAQHPATGGWRYRVGDTGDTSQLGWQMMALWSAQRAGVDVPAQTWTAADRFLRSVRRGKAGGLAAYRADGPPSTPMTAEALYCRQLIAEMIGASADSNATNEATAQVIAKLPEPTRINLYYWYYATLALHRQQLAGDDEARAWQAWNAALTKVLLEAQLNEGPDAGSWELNCIWGGYGGRVYTTAVAAMCLEVYYRYAPSPADEGWMATRPELRRLPK